MFIGKSLWLCIILPFILTSNGDQHPPGHLQPLGSQLPPVGEVLTVHEIPSPQEFFTEYVQPGKPVLFKGAATKMPAYTLWTDEYMSSKYGHLKVDVEEGKKENRSKELFNMPLSNFLKLYNESDVYLVYSLPKIMRDEILLLKCLLCGGYTDSLQDSVMWFSNGGTKSVLHYDAIDNINCLMSGSKDLFMVDKREKAHIKIDNQDGSFSQVDVDKVDLYKYPGLADVPWYRGRMEPGDCLFIPYRWFHQVRSYGPRNLAINIWFAHRLTFNSSDCDNSPYKNKDFAPLSAFDIAQKYDQNVKSIIIDEMEENPVDLDKWMGIWQNTFFVDKLYPGGQGNDLAKSIFSSMDTDKDLLVSPNEVIYASFSEDQQNFLQELFAENEDEEENEETDSDELRPEDGGRKNEITEEEDETDSFGTEIKHDDL